MRYLARTLVSKSATARLYVPRYIIISAITLFSLQFASAVVFAQGGDAATRIKSIVREASKECRAAKNLRRSDFEQAKSHFGEYVKLLNQAIEIKNDLLDAPDPSTQRVLDFCNVVKNDLDRAEALPLLEQGLRECGEARILISNAAFDEAREKSRLYHEYKDGALAISESVLVVYRNSYELRLCNNLENDILLAEEEYQEQLQITAQTETEDQYKNIVENLNQALRQCNGARNLIRDKESYNNQTIAQIKNLAKDAEKISVAAVAEREKQEAEGVAPDDKTKARIDGLLTEIKGCQDNVIVGMERVRVALNTTELRKSFEAKTITQDFRQIVGAPANYPRRAIRRGIQGYVTVKFTVTELGDVSDLEVVDADPEGWFEKAGQDAVKKYKFQPRIVDGQAVAVPGVEKKIVFKLSN